MLDQEQTKRVDLMNAEFDAAEALMEQMRRIKLTAVVDDDFPQVKADYDHAAEKFVKAYTINRYGRDEEHAAKLISKMIDVMRKKVTRLNSDIDHTKSRPSELAMEMSSLERDILAFRLAYRVLTGNEHK